MNNIDSIIKKIQKEHPDILCKTNEPLKNHTSIKIGGFVSALFIPKDIDELITLYKLLVLTNTPYLIIGNGTNLLVDDRTPLNLIAIKTTALNKIHLLEEDMIKAQSGVLLSKLSVFALENGLSGLEFAHGIPGTLGGAVAMNAGAYGSEMKDIIRFSSFINTQSLIFTTITNAEHEYSYRNSRFIGTDDIILSSIIRLKKDTRSNIKAKMDDLASRRRASQPLDKLSAGSTFKRPKDGFAAEMIDLAGLKGFSIGGAVVSEKHAGFIINQGSASFTDMATLIKHIQKTIYDKYGVLLEPEYRFVTNSDDEMFNKR